jgi:glycosyltransferase involved in cell wall biosynthesis
VSPHRIAIDVTPLITGTTGITRYVRELAAALEARPDATTLHRFAVGRALVPAPAATRHFKVPLRVVDRAWRWLGQPAVERLVGPVDTVHASGPVLPPAKAPVVAVVYDLAALDHPELHPARDVAQLQRYVAALPRAAAVLAISETTADALTATGVPADRVHVVPIGRTKLPEQAEAPPLAGRPYVLAVGAPVPRKGFDTLLRAVARLHGDVAVAIVGPPGSEDAALAALAADLGMSDRVHRAVDVSDAQLAGWYRSAAALAAPSVAEGFGLPLVEAMGEMIPVVASDIAVFREVTGGHALLVPVGETDALTGALAEALDASASVHAATEAGAVHAQRYTWEQCAAGTLAVHRALIS